MRTGRVRVRLGSSRREPCQTVVHDHLWACVRTDFPVKELQAAAAGCAAPELLTPFVRIDEGIEINN